MTKYTEPKEAIKELVKPARLAEQMLEVKSMCEPNDCTTNCNDGGTLRSPTSDFDILF